MEHALSHFVVALAYLLEKAVEIRLPRSCHFGSSDELVGDAAQSTHHDNDGLRAAFDNAFDLLEGVDGANGGTAEFQNVHMTVCVVKCV